MFTAKEAREMLNNRDLAPHFAYIKLCIAEKEDFALFLDAKTTGFHDLRLNKEKRNKLLSLGYKVEITNEHEYPEGCVCWKVSW